MADNTVPPPSLPVSVWLANQPETTNAALSEQQSAPRGSVLPPWAIERIRYEFGSCGAPASLIHLAVNDTAPGMDARAHCTTTDYVPAGTGPEVDTVLLAELHPDTLPVGDAAAPAANDIPDGWSGFLYRAHRLLRRRGGVLLLATRQRRDAGTLTDPLGALIACARTAGYTYLQHIVIVHGHADGNRLAATPPDTTEPDVVHSDLLVFGHAVSAESALSDPNNGEHGGVRTDDEGTMQP